MSLKLEPGTKDAETYPASGACTINADGSIGEPYARGKADRTPPCGLRYLRSSGAGTFPLRAAVTWQINWTGTGATGGDLPDGTFGDDQPVTSRRSSPSTADACEPTARDAGTAHSQQVVEVIDVAYAKDTAQEDDSIPAIDWTNVTEFTLGTVVRPVTKWRKRPVRGPRAIRVPQGSGSTRLFAPCAFVAPVAAPAPTAALEPCLYEDAEAQRLLCYLTSDSNGGSERRYLVHGDDGQTIGTIRRIPPPSRLFKHSWRIEQPGRPVLVGRNQWSGFHAKRIAEQAADKVIPEVLNALTGSGPDDTHNSPFRRSRTLVWVADGELVMVSEGIKSCAIEADWLDRRLAFAHSVLGDT